MQTEMHGQVQMETTPFPQLRPHHSHTTGKTEPERHRQKNREFEQNITWNGGAVYESPMHIVERCIDSRVRAEKIAPTHASVYT